MRTLSLMVAVCMLGTSVAGCGSSVRQDGDPATGEGPAADSLVMERSVCYGFCPAYRLRIDRAGRVHFQSLNPGDTSAAVRDSIPPEGFLRLLAEAERSGFHDLPERIDTSSVLCPVVATDHATVTTTIVAGDRAKRVQHYTGCREASPPHRPVPELERLHTFYAAVDSVAGASRWIRPARSDP